VQDTERRRDKQAATGPVVWLLEMGEMHEGGAVLGVYLDRDLARGRFIAEAQDMGRTFGIASVDQAMDGGITVEAGCDWLSLTPHPVIVRNEITRGGSR
jgi:hypothetical protein